MTPPNPITIAVLTNTLARIDLAHADFLEAVIEDRESGDALHEVQQAERARFLNAVQGFPGNESETTAACARVRRRCRAASQRFNATRDAYISAVAAFHDEVADLTTPT